MSENDQYEPGIKGVTLDGSSVGEKEVGEAPFFTGCFGHHPFPFLRLWEGTC